MHLFINALAASAGGGITYIRNVLPHLARRNDVRATVVLSPALSRELPPTLNLPVIECDLPSSAAVRFVYEQRLLPELIRKHGADVLLAAGNFALWRSPVPQILLSRNSLYVSSDYLRDLGSRGEYGLWLDTKLRAKLAAASIRRADVTVAPSAAFAADLGRWVGPRLAGKIVCIYHGFDDGAFQDSVALPPELAARLTNPQGALRLLFVSHYNYYRNFETLLQALPVIQAKKGARRVELMLTCKLGGSQDAGGYRPGDAGRLRDRLNLGSALIELGPVAYPLLHHVYRACDIYVTPAYAETFAHPLVEAMSSGLPVVASDLAVHREICGKAAVYFPRFSPDALATEVLRLAEDDGLRTTMSQAGVARSRDFSWERHVDDLLALAERITAKSRGRGLQ